MNSFYNSKKLLWGIVYLGIILRLTKYLFNYSLWYDECDLVLNLINRSFLELLKPTSHCHAPAGFLIVEKLLVHVFGSTEYVLRLFPLICGVSALFLFCKVARYYIKAQSIPIAIGLFAISGPLVDYSSEVSQYSSDVVIALLLFLFTVYIQQKGPTILMTSILGVIGAVVIWFSYPSIFILAGIGVTLAFFCLIKREYLKIGQLSVAYLLWILSFCTYYFIFLADIISNKRYQADFVQWWMPLSSTELFDIRWFIDQFINYFKNPVGIYFSGIALLMFIAGCISMFQDKKKEFFILISPIFFTLLATGLRKYPFGGRLLLFSVPATLFFIAEGVIQIRGKARHNLIIIGIISIVLLFYHPLTEAHRSSSYTREEIKPVISYIKKHIQNGDILYVYYGALNAFTYYKERYDLDNDYIAGVRSRVNWENYIDDLDKLRGNKRVWILFSHVWDLSGVNEEKFFLYHIERIGTRLDSMKSVEGASIYLYDLTERTAKDND